MTCYKDKAGKVVLKDIRFSYRWGFKQKLKIGTWLLAACLEKEYQNSSLRPKVDGSHLPIHCHLSEGERDNQETRNLFSLILGKYSTTLS